MLPILGPNPNIDINKKDLNLKSRSLSLTKFFTAFISTNHEKCKNRFKRYDFKNVLTHMLTYTRLNLPPRVKLEF